MKVYFESETSQKIERELLQILDAMQEISLRLVEVSYKIPFKETRGRLIGYSDLINSTSGNICELFEFYK